MIKQTKGKIFLADERGMNETNWFRGYNTFNFGRYQHEHKQPFGDMYVLNDDALSGGSSIKMLIEENSFVIILPVAGAVQYKDSRGNDNLLAAGQAQVFRAEKGDTIELINPFKDEWVNFLQVWIKDNGHGDHEKHFTTTYDDVNMNQNSLVTIFNNFSFVLSIGKFAGRGETIHKPESSGTGTFVFVLEGAFEVEGRLLHARDGLALHEVNVIEMEALSNDAIIILLELPFNSSVR